MGSRTTLEIDKDLQAAKIRLQRIFNRTTELQAELAGLVVGSVSAGGGLEYAGSNLQRSALTGDVTAGAGSGATAIASNAVVTAKIADGAVTTAKVVDAAVTNAKQANMAAGTVKANLTGGSAGPLDCTLANLAAALPLFGSTTRGLVPPPPSGYTLDMQMRPDGTWAVPGTTALLTPQLAAMAISYIFPTSSYWDVIETKASPTHGPVKFALFNPNNGPGFGTAFALGGSTNVAYQTRLNTAQAAGLKVLHYDSLNYRDEASAHTGDVFAGTVGKLYRFTAVANVVTTTADGTQTAGGAAGSAVAHGFSNGMGPFQVKLWNSGTTGGVLPAGLAASTNYYVNCPTSTTLKFYDTSAHAIAGGATGLVAITDAGTAGGFYIGLSKSYANVQNVLDNVDRILVRFPNIDGFFYDEAHLSAGTNEVAYFTAIYNYIKGINPNLIVALNGLGTTNAVVDLADVFCSENTAANLLAATAPAWIKDYDSSKFALIAHDVNPAAPTTDQNALIAYALANGYGILSFNYTSYSSLPSTAGSDSAVWLAFVAALVASNATPVADTVSYGELILTGGTHTPAGSSAYTKLNASCSAGSLSNFAMTTPQKLTYSSGTQRVFRISFDVTFKKASGSASDVTLRIARSGTTFSNRKLSLTVAATDVGYQTISGSLLVTLAPGQYVEIYAAASVTDVLTVYSGSLTITPVA